MGIVMTESQRRIVNNLQSAAGWVAGTYTRNVKETINDNYKQYAIDAINRYKEDLLEQLYRESESQDVINAVMNAMNVLDLERYDDCLADRISSK